MGSGTGKFVAFGILIVVALAIAGLITGAIGAGLTQSKEDKAAGLTAEGPFIPKPAVHLPAQVTFPTSDRTHYRNFLLAEEIEVLLCEKVVEGHCLEKEHLSHAEEEELTTLMHEGGHRWDVGVGFAINVVGFHTKIISISPKSTFARPKSHRYGAAMRLTLPTSCSPRPSSRRSIRLHGCPWIS